MQDKIFKLKQLKNNIETIFRNNKAKSLQSLRKQYLTEYNEIRNSYAKEIKQAELLGSDPEDIRAQMINQLYGLSKEVEFKARVENLKQPPRDKKRVFKSTEQYFNTQGKLYGSKLICREYAEKKRAECEADILDFINKTYSDNFEKAYARKVADSKEQLKRILSITEDEEEA